MNNKLFRTGSLLRQLQITKYSRQCVLILSVKKIDENWYAICLSCSEIVKLFLTWSKGNVDYFLMQNFSSI